MVVTSDGKNLITGSKDQTVKIFSLETKKVVGTISEDFEVSSVSISPDNKIIAVASLNNSVKLYDFFTRKHLQTLDHCCSPVIFGDRSRHLITADNQNRIKLWKKH